MKSLIKKLTNHLLKKCRKNQVRYFFARFLAELVKDNKATNDVLISIANYFIKYHDGNKFEFNDIFVVGNIVYIYTMRPGYWIGKAGSEADKLLSELNYDVNGKRIADYEIKFIEISNDAQSNIATYIRINF